MELCLQAINIRDEIYSQGSNEIMKYAAISVYYEPKIIN